MAPWVWRRCSSAMRSATDPWGAAADIGSGWARLELVEELGLLGLELGVGDGPLGVEAVQLGDAVGHRSLGGGGRYRLGLGSTRAGRGAGPSWPRTRRR